MITYSSPSSAFVKIATAFVLLSFVATIFILSQLENGTFEKNLGVILIIFFAGMLLYFFANSLKNIVVTSDSIIIKKQFGQIMIAKADLIAVENLGYSNLTMTYGSKGVFGFIGSTMDNCSSLVKDQKNMLRLTTIGKTYIVSAENSTELVKDLNLLIT